MHRRQTKEEEKDVSPTFERSRFPFVYEGPTQIRRYWKWLERKCVSDISDTVYTVIGLTTIAFNFRAASSVIFEWPVVQVF